MTTPMQEGRPLERTARPTARAAGRDTSLDVMRGLCVLSMTSAHLAKGTPLDVATHPVPHVDGASGFVLISGFLIGIVQRKTMEREGEGAGYRKLLLRARLVYLGHVYICLLALLLATVAARGGWLPSASGEGGWLPALVRTATLQIHPPYAAILSLYVVCMLLALPVRWLLRRRLWYLAALLLALVYGAGVAFPGWSQLPQRGGIPGGWDYATWFGLFGCSLLMGWLYSSARGRAFATHRRTEIAGWALAAVGVAVAFGAPALGVPMRLLDKETLGPGRILLALVIAYAGWRALSNLCERGGRARNLLQPVAQLGSHSLAAYLILTTVVLVVPWRVGEQPEGGLTTGLVGATIAVMAAYAVFRSGLGGRRSHRLSTAQVRSGGPDHRGAPAG